MTAIPVLDQLATLPPALAYTVVGGLVLAEAAVFVGFVLPGETAVLLAGALAATGHLSLAVLLPLVVVAAIVGDTIGYEVGRHLGPTLLRTRLLMRHADRLERARAVLRKRGGWAVFVGRFTAFLRAVMPGLAGLSQMPYRRFLVFNAAGAVVWGSAATLAGYLAGASYQRIAHAFGSVSAVLAVLLVGAALVVWRRHRTREEAPTP